MLRLWFLILSIISTSNFISANANWELAAALSESIDLINKTGFIIDSFDIPSGPVTALAYDSKREKIFFTSRNDSQYSIFELDPLDHSKKYIPVVTKEENGDVKSMSIDPVTDTLYWAVGHEIKKLDLTDRALLPLPGAVLYSFNGKSEPHDLTIDICNRMMYWTVEDNDHSAIQRWNISKDNDVIDELYSTSNGAYGIVIDYSTNRVYWSEEGDGSDMYIKSLSLDKGEEEEPITNVGHGNGHKPISLTRVDSQFFWVDKLTNHFYRADSFNDKMKILKLNMHTKKRSSSKLYSLISVKKNSFIDPKNCFHDMIQSDSPTIESVNESVNDRDSVKTPESALLDELSRLSASVPVVDKLECDSQKVIIDAYSCVVYCSLKRANFSEESRVKIYSTFNISTGTPCDCADFPYPEYINTHVSPAEPVININKYDDESKKFVYISLALGVVCIILMIAMAILFNTLHSLKKRPRIKKRIIVNKNVTPLTSRPQATEQCEITIENCCNMNICETPCFEPELRKPHSTEKNKKEEKRGLLTSIDLPPDDLY